MEGYCLLLASGSPRRKALMEELGIPFRVVPTGHIGERYPEHLTGGEIALHLAAHKSDACLRTLSRGEILLTADTVVWHRGRELGKPKDRGEALEMLTSLSGDTHQVHTGVCLRSAAGRRLFVASTDVTFAPIGTEEMEWYVERYRPYDKAGAYGIQEWIGHVAVEEIKGSYFNVMGLPVRHLYAELKQWLTQPETE